MARFIEQMWDDTVAELRLAMVDGDRRDREQRIAELLARSGQGFRIDPEQIPQVLADLKAARQRIKEIQLQAVWIKNTPAPGTDEVSRNAVQQIGEMAMGVDGSLYAALQAYCDEIDNTVEKLRDDLRTYLGTEQINIPPATAWS